MVPDRHCAAILKKRYMPEACRASLHHNKIPVVDVVGGGRRMMADRGRPDRTGLSGPTFLRACKM